MQAVLSAAHIVMRVVAVVLAAVVVVAAVVAAAACDIAPLHPIEPPKKIPQPSDVDQFAPDFDGTVAGQTAFVLKDDGTISAVDAGGAVLATFAAPDGAVSIAHGGNHHLFALTDTHVVMMIDRDGFVIDRMPLPEQAVEPIEHVAVVAGRIAVGGGRGVMFLDAPGAILRVEEPVDELFSIDGRVAYIAGAMRDLNDEQRQAEGLPPDPHASDAFFVEQVHVLDDGGVDLATSSMIAWDDGYPGLEAASGSDDALMWSVERYRNDGAYWVVLDVISLPDMYIDVDDNGFTAYSGLVSVASLPPLWVPLDVTVTPRQRPLPQ